MVNRYVAEANGTGAAEVGRWPTAYPSPERERALRPGVVIGSPTAEHWRDAPRVTVAAGRNRTHRTAWDCRECGKRFRAESGRRDAVAAAERLRDWHESAHLPMRELGARPVWRAPRPALPTREPAGQQLAMAL